MKTTKAKRRPAKVTTWRGLAVVSLNGFPWTYPAELARSQAQSGMGKLVRVTAKLTPVKL